MSSSARRLLLRLLLLPGLWMVASPALSSAVPGSSGALAAQEVSAPAAEPAANAELPRGAMPPRTLRAQAHVYVAFSVAWVLLFGYAVWVGRRFARVEREVEALGGR